MYSHIPYLQGFYAENPSIKITYFSCSVINLLLLCHNTEFSKQHSQKVTIYEDANCFSSFVDSLLETVNRCPFP